MANKRDITGCPERASTFFMYASHTEYRNGKRH